MRTTQGAHDSHTAPLFLAGQGLVRRGTAGASGQDHRPEAEPFRIKPAARSSLLSENVRPALMRMALILLSHPVPLERQADGLSGDGWYVLSRFQGWGKSRS